MKYQIKGKDKYFSQYIHGGINIVSQNVLSIGFVFRVVCVDCEYDPITCKLIPKSCDLRIGDESGSLLKLSLVSALEKFKYHSLEAYANNFYNFVSKKFAEWKW